MGAVGPTQRVSHVSFDLPTVDRLLTTTRSVRRRLDLTRPVDPAVVQECIDLAVHAPNADNQQSWRWVVITDPGLRKSIAELYGYSWPVHTASSRVTRRRRSRSPGHDADVASSRALVETLADVPVHVIPCVIGRPPSEADTRRIESTWGPQLDAAIGPSPEMGDGGVYKPSASLIRQTLFFGSIFPAVWSFQLALRSRGLGSVMTAMHLPFAEQLGALLGIPRLVTQICLVPVAHIRGEGLGVGPRVAGEEVTYWNRWEQR